MSQNFLVFLCSKIQDVGRARQRNGDGNASWQRTRVCYSRSVFLSFFQNEGGTAITVLRTSRRLQHQSRRNGNYQWRHAPRRLLVRDESDAIRYIPVYTHLHIAVWFFLFSLLRIARRRDCADRNSRRR